nr:DUF397 domain-containing protein [Amycolatopsis palatopharyngis]
MPLPQPMTWRKSSRSGGGENCVEVGCAHGTRAIRDTKLGETSPVLHVTDRAFTAFLRHLLR